MTTSSEQITTHGCTGITSHSDMNPMDTSYITTDAEPSIRTQHGSPFSSLLFNVLIPLAILFAGASVFKVLGSIVPKSRDADDQSFAGRMQRLPPANVSKVLSLEMLDKPLELRVDGVVVPFREVALAAEVSGRIVNKSAACEAGNFVKKGDLLLEIDAVDYQQSVERLTRMREQDYEAVKEIDQETANTQRMIAVAKEDVAIQEREVKRLESMPAGFASQGEGDKAKKSLLMSVQSKIGYENQLSLMAARRKKLEASERLATTELRGAEINLERTKIYSPVDGVIVRENAELNSFIQRGSPIVTLDDISKAEVAVNLRMDQLHWVLDQKADAAAGKNDLQPLPTDAAATPGYSLPQTPAIIEYEISGRSDKKYRWDGVLVRYDGIGLDPRSRTVPVRIVVDQPRQIAGADFESIGSQVPSPLVRGMFVSVRLLIRPKTPLVAIPSMAIQPGNRVWQFLPDNSVLDGPKPDTANQPSPEAAADAKTSEASTPVASEEVTAIDVASVPRPAGVKAANEFDPLTWKAGRVFIRRGIVPVDSLWLSGIDNVAKGADATTEERRYWICEVPGGEMAGGDWVVSSPLSDFDSQTSVRVPVKDIQ